MKKQTTKAPGLVAGEGFKEIAHKNVRIGDIRVTGNFRKTFNEKALRELADNIAKVGVLQPVILRLDETKGHILVAGERRFRAAAMVGLQEIPARILDINEEQALEVQALENLHRKDLSPIEEARAFKVLLDQKGHTLEQVQDLADRVGKSVNYVYRAVRLLELPKKVVDGIEEGKLTPAHGHQLLRAPKDHWDGLVKTLFEGNWDGEIDPASIFKESVEDACGKDLKRAYFPKDTDYAGENSCAVCQFNSENQGKLFDSATPEKGKCFSSTCFGKKHDLWIKEGIEKAKQYADKVGLTFLGSGKAQGWYENITFKGNKILKAGLPAKSLDAKKHAVGYITDGNNNERPRMVVVELAPKKKAAVQPEHDWEKDQFIRNAEVHAVWSAEAELVIKTVKASRETYEEAARNLLHNSNDEHYAKALKMEKIDLSKLSENELAAIILGRTRDYGWHPQRKQIEAEARKKALAEYKAMQEAEKSKKKAAK